MLLHWWCRIGDPRKKLAASGTAKEKADLKKAERDEKEQRRQQLLAAQAKKRGTLAAAVDSDEEDNKFGARAGTNKKKTARGRDDNDEDDEDDDSESSDDSDLEDDGDDDSDDDGEGEDSDSDSDGRGARVEDLERRPRKPQWDDGTVRTHIVCFWYRYVCSPGLLLCCVCRKLRIVYL
jgi:hypothetical protein